MPITRDLTGIVYNEAYIKEGMVVLLLASQNCNSCSLVGFFTADFIDAFHKDRNKEE